ncbi:unnamed protein product [Ectocarpus sp. 4 AP-2014]
MENSHADECTALGKGSARYDGTKVAATQAFSPDTSAAPPAAEATAALGMRSNGSSLSRLAVAVLSISAMFLVGVLLSSTANTHSTRRNSSGHDSSSSSSEAALNMLDSSAAADGKIVVPAMQPFSTVDPADAHCPHMDRPEDTWPTSAWGALANASVGLHTSLPTNAWWENIVLGFPSQETRSNNIVVIPYTFDVAGDTAGLRVHFPQVVASDLIVQTTFDWRHALQLGCVEKVTDHYITQPGPLSVTLNWDVAAGVTNTGAPAMSVPAVRGSPYATMEYRGVRPVISARQEVTQLVVDGERISLSSGCENGTSVHVEREVEIIFSGGAVSSDDTWLVFVSHPVEFLCSSWFAMERGEPPTPGAVGAWQSMPRFRLEAVRAVSKEEGGVVRAAMVNTCTSGTSNRCTKPGEPDDREDYAMLLRAHAEVYPTGQARVSYSSSGLDWIEDALQGDVAQTADTARMAEDTQKPAATAPALAGASPKLHAESEGDGAEEEGNLRFLWAPKRMDGKPVVAVDPAAAAAAGGGDDGGSDSGERDSSGGDSDSADEGADSPPLIMFALLHHRQAFTAADGLTDIGTPSLHGQAELAIGDEWSMKVALPPVSFGVGRPVREEMVADVNEALDEDVKYEMPKNYLRGEGDTYFSGKMLAKMGRIALIAEEMGRPEDARMVAARLAEASQVWLNGTAGSPLLYDFRWGGVVTCGCAYKKEHGCMNGIGPYQCPGLSDPGMNFGLGFYNDHHFHFGYHIFAAAIVSKFFPDWGIKHHEAVTLLIRDIANPSSSDPFFPVFRHKDWFLGSSWALGIPTLGGVPYMNGRNQESSSEAVNAYYAVALYGHVMAQVFSSAGDPAKAQTASLIRDTGRQLLATEVQSAQIYWQVANVGTPDLPRVYPEAYRPHVVGMLWSTLAQMQTWFGAEAWKVYGIQMLPITGVSEQLLDPRWVQQMLPSFEDSCLYDSNPIKACVVEGWSMLVHAGQAITGRWEDGRDGIMALPDDVFETAGGNGHSRTSMLWFVANRPPLPPPSGNDDSR